MAVKYKWVKHPEFPNDANRNGLLYAEDGVNYRVSINRGDTGSGYYQEYLAWVAAGNTTEAAD